MKLLSPKRVLPFRVWRYIFFDYCNSFILIFVFFIVVFIGNQLLLLAKRILQVAVPLFEVIKLFVYLIPEVIAQSIPYAALVACLMSVGNFSSSNEFVAMRTNGISFLNSFVPYVFFSLFIVLFSFIVNESILPWGKIQASLQYRKLLYVSPQLELDQNSVKRYQDYIIITKRITDDNIEGLIIIDQDNDGNKRVITADTAKLVGDERRGVLSLSLDDVVSISREVKPQEYSYLHARKLTYNLLVKDLSNEIQSVTASQKSITDLKEYMDYEYAQNILPEKKKRADAMQVARATADALYVQASTQTSTQPESKAVDIVPAGAPYAPYLARYYSLAASPVFNRNHQIHAITFHRKISEPVVVLIFVCLAFPIGLFTRRSGKTIGFGVGLSVSFLYWMIGILNQTVGITNPISPALIMWYHNAAIFLLALFLLYLRRRH